MKTIIKSVLFTATLALIITGCQKEAIDLDSSLKSKPTDVVTEVVAGSLYWHSVWSPAGGAEVECSAANDVTLGNCGYSFKIDPWDNAIGDYYTGENNHFTITYGPNNSFNWESDFPVCKVIVKAGTGAYVYYYNPSVYSDNGLIGSPDSKGISHVTFCYGPQVKIITYKCVYTDGVNEYFGVTDGINVFSSDWCSEWFLGVNNYPSVSPITLHEAGSFSSSIGTLTVDAMGDVTVNLNEGLSLVLSALFVGSEDDLKSNLTPYDNCPAYYAYPWIYRTSGDLYFFDLPSL